MRTQTYWFGVLPFIILPTSFSATADTLEQKQLAEKVLTEFISDNRAPGLQYIFVDEKQTLFHYETGLANIIKNTQVQYETTFNGYSITKTLTAAAVINLAQLGKINLDDPISRYLPNLPYSPSPTIRQLLHHTSGISNPNPLKWIHINDVHSQFDEQAFIQQVIKDNDELDNDPGEEFAYSNVGYLVLGQLIQKISGKTFEAYISEEIIKPLNLEANETISFNIDKPELHAQGYIRKWNWLNLLLGFFIDRDTYMESAKDGWTAFKLFMPNGKAYGGVVGNAAGLSRYLQAILSRQPPFTRSMVDTLLQTGKTNDGDSLPVAMAWFKSSLNGISYFSHSGGAGGYYCEIRIYPEINRASVIMTNNTGISAQHYLDQIDPIFLGKD